MTQEELNNKAFSAFGEAAYFVGDFEHIIDFNVLKDAINNGADPNCFRDFVTFRSERLLSLAISNRCNGIHVMQYLIHKGADPSLIRHFYKDVTTYSAWTRDISPKHTKWVKDCYKQNRRIKKFLKSYKFQKAVIQRYPDNCYQLYKSKLIHPDIYNEYKYLIEANELNLL